MIIDAAVEAAQFAYAPYSKYLVGAAILTPNNIIKGCNIENASYGLTLCAERTAIFKAISDGHKEFLAIAVATIDGSFPCGACRQVLLEFNPQLPIIITNFNKKNIKELTLNMLLPESFASSEYFKT